MVTGEALKHLANSEEDVSRMIRRIPPAVRAMIKSRRGYEGGYWIDYGHSLWDYEWSSAGAHLGGADQPGLLDFRGWQHRPREWQQRLERAEDDETLAAIRRSTSRGRPLAGDSFLSKLEHTLGKRLRALPVGRPRKEK